MSNNRYFTNDGTVNDIEINMVDTITDNKVNADLLFNFIDKNQDLLSENESFFLKKAEPGNDDSSSVSLLGFMLLHQKYHINIKFATHALICLLFDIKCSQGFAGYLFGAFGLNYAVVKLDDIEKCIAYRLKKEKSLSLDELKQPYQCSFTYCNSRCGNLNDDGTCNKWENGAYIEKALASLLQKNVVKQKGDKYALVF